MSQLVVRRLPDPVKEGLKALAHARGISLEEQARRALEQFVMQAQPQAPQEGIGFGTRIASRFAHIGLENPLPELRGSSAVPMQFSEP